jgi:hypothetical protein
MIISRLDTHSGISQETPFWIFACIALMLICAGCNKYDKESKLFALPTSSCACPICGVSDIGEGRVILYKAVYNNGRGAIVCENGHTAWNPHTREYWDDVTEAQVDEIIEIADKLNGSVDRYMNTKDTRQEKQTDGSAATTESANGNYVKAMTIINDPVFRNNISLLSQSERLTRTEQTNLNNAMKPLCGEAMKLLFLADEEEQHDARIQWEIVKLLFLNFTRIFHVGTIKERTDAMITGFTSPTGENIMGYPDMLKYYVDQCEKNDAEGRYREEVRKMRAVLP